ncbi:hypothetical protein KI387_031431, partial [Taxus chinensis]
SVVTPLNIIPLEEEETKKIEEEMEEPQPHVPWGRNTGLPTLTPPLHELPKGSHKKFPKFKGDGTQLPEEHIIAFIIACGVLGVEHEDVS